MFKMKLGPPWGDVHQPKLKRIESNVINIRKPNSKERQLPETQRKCLPCDGSSISINSTRFCFVGLNKTLCISSLRRDDITAEEKKRGRRRRRSSGSSQVHEGEREKWWEGLRAEEEDWEWRQEPGRDGGVWRCPVAEHETMPSPPRAHARTHGHLQGPHIDFHSFSKVGA